MHATYRHVYVYVYENMHVHCTIAHTTHRRLKYKTSMVVRMHAFGTYIQSHIQCYVAYINTHLHTYKNACLYKRYVQYITDVCN